MNIAFDLSKPIVVGADHAGFEYKQTIIDFLNKNNIPYKDFGTNSPASVDYPDFAHPVASAVNDGEAAVGILVCGSANGVAITANKYQGVRAAITWLEEIAALARQHNNANVICIPARYVSTDDALQMITTFLGTAFEGGRHANRVNKIGCM
jgi:ribose 5-phosphate isomerase B